MGRMQTHPTGYPTDLTDEEWEYIECLVPAPKCGKGKRGRPLKLDRRTLVNGIFYVVRSGCAGDFCPETLVPGKPSMVTIGAGLRIGLGGSFTTRCEIACARPKGERSHRPPRSLTVNRSRSPIKPASAATTRAKRCRGANATWRWTAWD